MGGSGTVGRESREYSSHKSRWGMVSEGAGPPRRSPAVDSSGMVHPL